MFLAPDMWPSVWQSLWQTLAMIGIAGGASIVIGLPLGILLYVTRPGGMLSASKLYAVLSFVVNILRSVPFIILLVAIIPFTRWVTGTSIGTLAASVPLAISAFPFVARVVESACEELHSGLVEAAQSMGATPLQIIWHVLLSETLPGIVRGITLMLVTLVGYSAMAGAVGGGGLGSLAIEYGYDRFDVKVMIVTVIILILLVQLIQWLGDKLANYLQRS